MTIDQIYLVAGVNIFVVGGLVLFVLKQRKIRKWRVRIPGGADCYYLTEVGLPIKAKVGFYHQGLGEYCVVPEDSNHREHFRPAKELFPL